MAASQAKVCKGFIEKFSGGALAPKRFAHPVYCGEPATVWPKPDVNAAIRPVHNHACARHNHT